MLPAGVGGMSFLIGYFYFKSKLCARKPNRNMVYQMNAHSFSIKMEFNAEKLYLNAGNDQFFSFAVRGV